MQNISNNLQIKTTSFNALKIEHTEVEKQTVITGTEIGRLKVFLTDRDKTIQVLRNEKEDLMTKLGESLQQFNTLNELVKNLSKPTHSNRNDTSTEEEDPNTEPDIIILHDSLFKGVKSDFLMRREKQKVLLKWSPKLGDALNTVLEMQEKPKVVMLHSGTNDLGGTEEKEMIESIKRMYDVLEARGIKFIYSYILPRVDRDETAKAEVINSRVVQMFARKDEVCIGRNDRFYYHGIQSDRLFDEDGIHVNDEGTKAPNVDISAEITMGGVDKILSLTRRLTY